MTNMQILFSLDEIGAIKAKRFFMLFFLNNDIYLVNNTELMWGLFYNGLCLFAFTVKCLSSHIKTLIRCEFVLY